MGESEPTDSWCFRAFAPISLPLDCRTLTTFGFQSKEGLTNVFFYLYCLLRAWLILHRKNLHVGLKWVISYWVESAGALTNLLLTTSLLVLVAWNDTALQLYHVALRIHFCSPNFPHCSQERTDFLFCTFEKVSRLPASMQVNWNY